MAGLARLLLVGLALAACGNAASPGAGDTETSTGSASASGGSSQTPSASPPPGPSGELTVLAAASLTDAFEDLGARLEAANPGLDVVFSFAASSELAAQVIAGAPADVLATASTTTMDQVVAEDLTTSPPEVFAGNVLQLAVPPGNPAGIDSITDLADPDLTIALCAPEVPCGVAAGKLLELVGVAVEADTIEPDVRSALTKVELGEVDVAMVYRTDVLAAGEAVEGIEIAEAGQVVNSYPIAPLVDAPNRDAAAAFVALVLSAEGIAALEKAGFLRP